MAVCAALGSERLGGGDCAPGVPECGGLPNPPVSQEVGFLCQESALGPAEGWGGNDPTAFSAT